MENENNHIQLLDPHQSFEEWMLSSGLENPEFDPSWMRRAQMSAIRYDRPDIMEEILECLWYMPGDLYEDLMEAYRLEKKELFHLIVSRSSDPACLMQTVKALARWHHNDCLLEVLEREGIITAEQEEDYLIQHFAANNAQDLFQFPISETWLDDTVERVLYDAAAHKNEKMLEWGISSAGSRIARLGGPALLAVCDAGNLPLVQKLVFSGVNIEYEEPGPYSRPIQAAAGGHPDIVAFLLEQGANPHGCDDCNYGSAMWRAAWKGDIESIRLLLAYGCSPDDAETTGQTPLIAALENRHFKIAECLLSHGADINHLDMMKEYTPLMEMVMLKNFSSVRFLAEHGASLKIMSRGKTAYDLAKKYSTPGIRNYLEKLFSQDRM